MLVTFTKTITFTTLKSPVNPNILETYMCCQVRDQTMTGAWVCLYREDRFGRPHGVTFMHYKCREFFKAFKKGKWHERGMPGRCITWFENENGSGETLKRSKHYKRGR